MCDDEEAAALVIDNGSGMVKVSFVARPTHSGLKLYEIDACFA